MADAPRLSHTSAMILQAIGAGHIYGYTVMEVTGLPSGTVYPALRRMERDRVDSIPVGAPVGGGRRAAAAAQVLQAHPRRGKNAGSLAEALSVAGKTGSQPRRLRTYERGE